MSILNFFSKKKEQSPREEFQEVLVMDEESISPENNVSVKNITEYYVLARNAFIESFTEKQQFFEECVTIKTKELENALSEEYYEETTIKIGGISCAIKNEIAIENHYKNLSNELEQLKKNTEKRRKLAIQQYQNFKKEADEALKLEQNLVLQGLLFETILPTKVLNDLIYPLPMYVFKNLDNEGNFFKTIDIYNIYQFSMKRNTPIVKRICFDKEHLVDIQPSGDKITIKEKIIFPEADRDIQDKILAFYLKGYKPYTIAHEDAFNVNLDPSEEDEWTRKDPISAVDEGNMTILIAQYGDFDMEKELLKEAKNWFDKVHEKCFSLN